MIKNILLIAGHGDGDPGAIGNGYREADLTREMARLIKPHLDKYVNVDIFDMTKDMYKYLNTGHTFNFKTYDYVVEIHLNSTFQPLPEDEKTTGSEILIHELERGSTVEEKILENLEALGLKNRGIKPVSNLLVMNTCKRKQGVSHALIEICFIKDADDMKIYASKKEEIAKAIVKGIADGFGLKTKDLDLQDISGHYAEDYIKDLYNLGIVKGDGNGNYKPDENLKRGDAAIMIRNAIKFITGK